MAWSSRTLSRLVQVQPGELKALLWAFSYFFALLCAYYIIRPMRDEMGIAGGVENLQWLFTGTFLAMLAVVPLFGWVTTRFSRARFLPLVYLFFIVNLLLFYGLFHSGLTHTWVARAFFIWTSVFNLFIVSVFWSFMADLFNDEQAKRLFGFIAAGGTAGALTGPALTASLVLPLGPTNLLLLSAALLGWAVVAIRQLAHWHEQASSEKTSASQEGIHQGLGGGVWDGIRLILRSRYLGGICLLILLYTTLSTFLYFQQAKIVRDSFDDPATRTALFAAMDFAVNALTLLVQVFMTGRIVKLLGLGWSLAIIPLVLGAGFLLLGLMPVLAVLVMVQVVRRAGNYAIMKPSREMLFVVLQPDEKYKAKNVIDTVIYRSGDVVSAWAYTGLQALGFSLSQIALLAVPIAGLWALLGLDLGQRQEEQASLKEERS